MCGIAGILLGRGVSVTVTALLNWPTLPSLPAIVAAVCVPAAVYLTAVAWDDWHSISRGFFGDDAVEHELRLVVQLLPSGDR